MEVVVPLQASDLEGSADGGYVVLGRMGEVWVGRVTPELVATPWGQAATARCAVRVGDQVLLGFEDGVRRMDPTGVVEELVVGLGPVYDLASSPDGRWVAGALMDGRVFVWEAPDLELAAVLEGHEARVAAVAFSPDGRWLVSGSWDASVRLWSVAEIDEPAELLLDRLQRAWGRRPEELLVRAP